VQEAGFDHTVQLAYGVAAGTSRALALSVEQTAHALALAGASAQGLVITRAEYLSNWKGIQSADVAMSALTCVLLARESITGPLQVLDGKEGFPKAFKQAVRIDWQAEPLDSILRCSIKAHNAKVHTQPVLEAVLALREQHRLASRLTEIERIEVEVFKQAYNITGSGEEAGNKYDVRTKEQADHSLPYLVAVALLDGEVTPRQFAPTRIMQADVQQLLHKVRTLRDDEFTKRYPHQTPRRVNNAAYQMTRDGIADLSSEEWDRTLKTNLYAMFWLCNAALPSMAEGGAIINTASVQAFQPSPTPLAYATTKGAIVTFTKAFAADAIKRGIRVNAVAPGPVWTPLIPSTVSPEHVEKFGENTPMGRAGQPVELAPIYVFLASSESSYITGEVIGATGADRSARRGHSVHLRALRRPSRRHRPVSADGAMLGGR